MFVTIYGWPFDIRTVQIHTIHATIIIGAEISQANSKHIPCPYPLERRSAMVANNNIITATTVNETGIIHDENVIDIVKAQLLLSFSNLSFNF